MTVIKCKISDRLFQGFEVNIDLDYYHSLEEICNQVKRTLITHLQMYNFQSLVSKAKQINFHIHDYKFGEILLFKEDEKLWVCNH